MTPLRANSYIAERGQILGRERQAIRLASSLSLALSVLVVAGCSGGLPSIDKLNPFKEKVVPLAGKRVSIMPQSDRVGGGELAAATSPITLPAQMVNANWTQAGGTPNNAPGHLAASATLRRSWSIDAGKGSSSKGRLTAAPIVYGGRIYTLDAASQVSSFNAASGGSQWRKSLVPEKETGYEGYGGGLAIDNGRLYVSTGFGSVVALDPGSGKQIWEKKLGVPVRAAPTAVGDRVFVISKGGVFFCLSGVDGSELWQFRGLPEVTSLSYSPSPAVDGDVVTVPYPNGDIVALSVADGTPIWQENLAKTRTTTSFAAMSDAAAPAMSGGVTYSIGHGGRFVATQQASGERVWALDIGGVQRPWVAGDSVFVVDTRGQLVAVERTTGKIRWTTQLAGSKVWSGPVLAGGMLWLTSNKGQLVSVDATAGRVASKINLGGKVYVPPVVADGRLYVLTDAAKLVAFR
ncbi:MAG: outer membrane protein assembly factor BamB [Hyphomicrobiaceae bacterium]|jgi:outer membrane protein assembly factor BamB